MTNKHGDFIWYELSTSDADGAADFYGAVVGWTSVSAGQPDMDYRFFSSGDGSNNADGVGGFMEITGEMAAGGARPAWIGYIMVDDVDASAETITASGGNILMPAMDIPGVGRMAMAADPQAAPFYIMRGASDETSHSFAATEPKIGHCAWNELFSSNPEASKAFYADVFGWLKNGDMDMGSLGKYEFLKVGDDRGFMIGAVMPLVPPDPESHWMHYFRVANIDDAIAAIVAGGGQVTFGPDEIPGGDFSLKGVDPQGAHFALIGPSASEASS